jgi:hypothetical protein
LEGNNRLVKIKAPTYEPFGDELNGSIALFQAASAIDAAVYLAVESKNIDKLMDAAAMWIGLSERLGIEPDTEESEEESDTLEKRKFGFSTDREDIIKNA